MKASNECQRKAHFTFIWTIENANALLVCMTVESPTFIMQSMENTKWKLKNNIFVNGTIHLAIERQEDNGPDSIEIEFELSVLAADGSPLRMGKSEKEFKCTTQYYISSFQRRDEIFFYKIAETFPNDALTVRCRMWRAEAEISKVDACFARTRLSVDRRCSIWALREFSRLQPEKKRSHRLYPTLDGSPQLILSLFLKERNGKNYVNIQIDQNYATRDNYIYSKISLLDSDGKVVHSVEGQEYIDSNFVEVLTFEEFFEKDELMNDKTSLLPNDVLSLRCEFIINAEPVWSRIENYRYLNLEELESLTTEKSEMHLSEQGESIIACCPFKKAFEGLYGEEGLSDINLQAGATSLPAHKTVLSARSPVFKAMFTQDKRENISKIIDIPDMDGDTIRRLLLYIYKDTVQDLEWKSARDLFRAADKYQLLDLKKKCSLFLKSNLSVSNVCHVLILADMHKDGNLRKGVEDFISKHDNIVFDSDEWKKFKEENFRLALEIMERIILSINQSNY
ncbi:Speckle-type POZ protein [Araneus ventricosus]|uniref:Speckle-type POZ protein n=1 Tax=Araneus ventricosus TaxID=182803 RepID=A0A4Y2NGA9_ARAVE|nr:Speckle-type POZ protein [Araneus ventricosus]